MPTLQLKLDSKINKNSKEFQSIFDTKKKHNLYKVAEICLNATKPNRGGSKVLKTTHKITAPKATTRNATNLKIAI